MCNVIGPPKTKAKRRRISSDEESGTDRIIKELRTASNLREFGRLLIFSLLILLFIVVALVFSENSDTLLEPNSKSNRLFIILTISSAFHAAIEFIITVISWYIIAVIS